MSQSKKTSISFARFCWGLFNHLALGILILGAVLNFAINFREIREEQRSRLAATQAEEKMTGIHPAHKEPQAINGIEVRRAIGYPRAACKGGGD